ncbi:kinesin heavy chain [Acrasis kona]|uniref:Kinesin heavy chain n=1 Tax=Acrasis kona TaxID=1008807 RepID=A0AAW2ZNE1_9EUKA
MEKIKDLLDQDRESGRGIYIQGSLEEYVTSAEEVFQLMKFGAKNRVVSSRSHSIFIVSVNQKHLVNLDSKSGKLFLVDLAGSEKVKKTGAAGKLQKRLTSRYRVSVM